MFGALIKISGIAVVVFLFSGISVSQDVHSPFELLEQAEGNASLLSMDPEMAFKTAVAIERKARNARARPAELKAVLTQCEYHRIRNDFENMLAASEVLATRSSQYESPLYQLIAKRFLFEAYMFSGLPDNAKRELEKGVLLMELLDDGDSLNIMERSNFLIAYSNYYLLQGDFKNQLNYIKLSGKELDKLPKRRYNRRLMAVHYSNLATSFNKNSEKDSAEFYANLSQSNVEDGDRNDVTFNNLILLGDVEVHRGNFEKALGYLEAAEKLALHKNHLDIGEMYDNMMEANRNLGRSEAVKLYRFKLDSLNLSISENRNKTLHRLLSEKEQPQSKNYPILFSISFLALGLFTFFVVRKNRILVRQENESQKYLATESANPSGEDYSNLLKVLRENDPAFMFHFEEVFPDFEAKLRTANPAISSSEIEFCALLKLKLPTKDIARYKFVAPKTVRNWKYRIRKKLNIPKGVDIYQWFADL